MSLSSTLRTLSLALALAMGFALALPAERSMAHDADLPFDIAFPQEVEKTTFSNTWGARRQGGRRHKGTDLMAEKMSEVYAFAAGEVTKVGNSRRPGRYLIIEHPGGWDTYYIHLNNDTPGTDDGKADWSFTIAPGIEEGAQVQIGQLIGWVGDSGNAEGSGSHTHFELLHNGRNIDPYHELQIVHDRAIADLSRKTQVEAQLASGLEIS